MSMKLQDNATGFQHLGFPTNDLAETVAFYEKLGFAVALRTYNEEAGEAVAFLQLGNLMLEIYENHQAPMQTGAWDHLAIDVKDIEAAYQEVCSLGLNNQKDTIHFLPFWENGVKFFKITGPNREVIEFSQIL
ncbi:VOC family protein [Ruminococcus sp.]|uniref:VOC family protein n=2 Tax=Oscillospiraceae TaxID=216572 RepID=UPI003A937F27